MDGFQEVKGSSNVVEIGLLWSSVGILCSTDIAQCIIGGGGIEIQMIPIILVHIQ